MDRDLYQVPAIPPKPKIPPVPVAPIPPVKPTPPTSPRGTPGSGPEWEAYDTALKKYDNDLVEYDAKKQQYDRDKQAYDEAVAANDDYVKNIEPHLLELMRVRDAMEQKRNEIIKGGLDRVYNPFPPPYADRGAFNWCGDDGGVRPAPQRIGPCYYTVWNSYANQARADAGDWEYSDTTMARNAYENCIRWTMAYCASNPYDLTVPRPANAQSAMDRPLFAFDIFTPSGVPRSKRSFMYDGNDDGNWRDIDLHPVIWGSAQARFSQRKVGIVGVNNFDDYARFCQGVMKQDRPRAYPRRGDETAIDGYLNPLELFKADANGYNSRGNEYRNGGGNDWTNFYRAQTDMKDRCPREVTQRHAMATPLWSAWL